MMEGNFWILFFAFMGGLSLYVVIATIVGRAVYSRTKSWEEDTRFAAAIFCGFLFPISVPIIILIIWIVSIINVPLGNDSDDAQTTNIGDSQELNAVRSRVKDLEEARNVPQAPKPKTKFKVGDLITGVSGNPSEYKHLYEGCICRVLKTNDDKAMSVVLVDHIDFNAHQNYIGKIFKAPPRNFTLIQPKTVKRKVVKKKKR